MVTGLPVMRKKLLPLNAICVPAGKGDEGEVQTMVCRFAAKVAEAPLASQALFVKLITVPAGILFKATKLNWGAWLVTMAVKAMSPVFRL